MIAGQGVVALQEADLYWMLTIRLFEQRLLALFAEGKLGGTTHTCVGQEYVPVAVSALLREDDFVFSNHRGHGHYLARFRDPLGLLTEIAGRAGAVCNGVGGSQHIGRGSYFSTGVQGESIPVASGVALALKTRGAGALALAYIGDGTWGEGVVYEGLNIAALWSLPLVVVVENNRIAQTTPLALNMAGTIENRVAAFGIDFVRIAHSDVGAIRDLLAPRFDRVRVEHRPLVVEFETQRLGPHSKGDDTRPDTELRSAEANDWCTRYEVAHPEQFERVQRAASTALEEVFSKALASPPSEWEPSP